MRVSFVLMACAIGVCLVLGAGLLTSFASVSTLEATVNIHPETLNCKHAYADKAGGRWITAYIELPEDGDISDIDISTVLLDGVPAESDSKYGFVKNPEMKDRDENGVPELMVKFDKHAVVNHVLSQLVHMMPIPKRGKEIPLTITGSLIDGRTFEGSDAVRAIHPE